MYTITRDTLTLTLGLTGIALVTTTALMFGGFVGLMYAAPVNAAIAMCACYRLMK